MRVSSDRPLTDPQEDRLGYRAFSRRLASSISALAPEEGLVLGIYGAWGAGKSTLLNFVTAFLKSEKANHQIVHFNPWWFSGSDDLVRTFFTQISNSIEPTNAQYRKLRSTLADLGEAATKLPIPDQGILKAAVGIIKPKTQPLAELKKQTEEILRKSNQRLIIVIDDIDRLSAEETRQLFQVVKAIADLPRLVYLLAFDRDVVAAALDQAYPDSGQAYLEKIVQVPFELPLPDQDALSALLFERLDRLLQPLDESEFDQQYWGNLYLDGISVFIKTPRDVTRLSNALEVTYPSVRDEANAVDFIAIEALRVFAPHVYNEIRMNPTMFAGHSDAHAARAKDTAKEFHESYLQLLTGNRADAVRRMLQRMFPKLQSVWSNVTVGADFESSWRKGLRVCSPSVFPIYFRLELPPGEIGTQEMRRSLELAADSKVFGEHLISLAQSDVGSGSSNRAVSFLQRMEDFTQDDIPDDHIGPICRALFDSFDALHRTQPDRLGFLDFGIETRIGRVFFQLLRRLDEVEREELLVSLVNEGASLAMVVREVAVLGQMHGKYGSQESNPPDEQLISAEFQGKLEELAAARIATEARAGSLLQGEQLAQVLAAWQDWQPDGEIADWLVSVQGDTEFLLRVLESSMSAAYSQGMGFAGLADRVAKREYRIDPRFVERFVTLGEARETALRLLDDHGDILEERQTLALQTFVKAIDLDEAGDGDA